MTATAPAHCSENLSQEFPSNTLYRYELEKLR